MKRKRIVILILIAYVAVFFSLAVLFRESSDKCNIRLNLFKDLLEPGPEGYKDLILNIVCFIPVGLLVGLLLEKHRLAKALLVGLLVSLTIEFSQLIWHRGVFDVNDLFNNALGAMIGGLIAVGVINGTQRHKPIRDSFRRETNLHNYHNLIHK